MASLGSIYAVVALSLSLPLVSHAQAQPSVTISSIGSQSSIYKYTVRLQCTSQGVQGNYTFFRQIENQIDRVIGERENNPVITFNLLPSLEGYYYCQVGNVTSSNQLKLMSYPVLDRDIASTVRIPGSVGDTITVPCAYQRGRFEDRYEVTWHKGNDIVDTSTSQYDHFSIQRDFSMVIGGIKPADASNAYFCEVRVNVTGGEIVVKQAPMINVDVIVPISVAQSPREQIVAPNTEASFTCKISGIPMPTVKWTFNGREITNGRGVNIAEGSTTLRNNITVDSTLRLTVSHDSGQVTCIGYHMEGDRIVAVASEAHLIVLSDRLQPQLIFSQRGPQLSIELPSIVPGQFDIIVKYSNNDLVSSTRVISHPEFRNTREVNILIPIKSLPDFKTFQVRVALMVANKTGGSSVLSNQITVDEFPSDTITITETGCTCPEVKAGNQSNSNSSIVALISVFIVLCIIAIAIGSVVLSFCIYNMRGHLYKVTEERDDGGGRFSEERDVTKTPLSYSCNSPDSARPRSRKDSASSHGSRGSCASSEVEYDTIADHKDLEQWDEKHKAAAADTIDVDAETGIVMHSGENKHERERVVYHHHRSKPKGREELPGQFVTNPALIHHYGRERENTKMKPSESTSSFEDLEEESQEFKADAPRTA